MSGDLPDRVAAYCAQHALLPRGARIVVAVSGGADSLALLHILAHQRESLDLMLVAATLDHGLRGAAGAGDAAFVRQTAQAWGVPLASGRADVAAFARESGLGIEEAARRVRYAFLARVARAAGAQRIALGHHRDDQAETVLLHLIRGSGITGLRGMLPLAPLDTPVPAPFETEFTPSPPASVPPDAAPLHLIRPLLDVPRADIDAYAAAHHLHPRHDATNTDPAYTRNYIRHAIMPLLARLNPAVSAALARTADTLRADADRLHAAGEAALARVQRESSPARVTLDRAAWHALHLADKRHIVRAVYERLRADRPGGGDLGLSHVSAAIHVADAGATGAQCVLPGGVRLMVDYDALVFGAGESELVPRADAPLLDAHAAALRFVAGDSVQQAVGAWEFTARPLAAGDDLAAIHADPLAAALLISPGAAIELRRRAPGDRFQPRGMAGRSQKLKDTLNGMRVPAALRDRVPLVTVDGAIAWFVAPSADGVRGRVAQQFSVPDTAMNAQQLRVMLVEVMQWRRRRQARQ